ncbi:OsmC family protein [Fodinibius sp.]|uniref:OsmC family protein n=1 Tax=Fodinibius sp. TaxID=1872440 RepID=UPI002ACE1A55|nr:OsmC family protein [Fodinibius sp.]MDZ7657712.1 OsmC family protein [Fodinibius sp.]
MPTQKASAQWNGDLKNGNGTMEFGNGAYSGSYTFASRFEQASGTNPEELIGAAHAGCFSMALSLELSEAGYDPKSIDTRAEVTFEVNDNGPAISGIKLITKANVPDIGNDDFQEFANGAKKGCPVSKALAGTDISLEAELL